jgi:hypothetical protein
MCVPTMCAPTLQSQIAAPRPQTATMETYARQTHVTQALIDASSQTSQIVAPHPQTATTVMFAQPIPVSRINASTLQ